MLKFGLILLVAVIGLSLSAEGSVSWEASSGRPLGGVKVSEQEGAKVLIYAPERPHVDNYLNVGSVAANPGDEMTMSAEIKIPKKLGHNGFCLRAIVFDENGKVLQDLRSSSYSAVTDWKTVSHSLVLPEGAKKVLLRAVNVGTDPVWIRKVELRPKTEEEKAFAFHYAGTDEEKLILHSYPIQVRTALDYEHPAPGDRYSLLIAHEHDTTALKVIDIGSPMPTPDGSPRRLERMTFSVYPLYGSGDLKLLPVAQDGDINLATTNFAPGLINFTRDCPPGRWYTFEYKVPEKFQLASPSFLLRLYGRGKTLFRLGLPRFYYSDGTEVTGFSVWKDPMALFPDWSKTPFRTDLTSDGKVLTNALFVMNAAQGPEMLLKIKTLIPNFGIDTLGNIREALRSREWLEKNGFSLGYQNIPPGLWQEALKLDLDMLSVKPESYQKTGADLHKFNTAHPGWRAVYAKLGERFKDYGINEIMSIDCIFQQGDAEQYEPWFRGFLSGEDEGFALYNDPAGAKPHRFADYFRIVTGLTPTPEMFGFKSWDEYKITPLAQVAHKNAGLLQRKRGYLDMRLRHYAFLMYNSRTGSALKQFGIDYFLMNNGDDWMNGNDWSLQVQCRDIPGFVEETFFYHPRCVLHAVPDAMAFRELYRATGTRHRLIQEVGLGGHGNPYWDADNTFALVGTVCAANRYQSLQVDWPFESSFKVLRGQANAYDTPRYNQFLTMATAYNLMRELGETEIPESTRKVIDFHETSAVTAGTFRDRRLITPSNGDEYHCSNANFNLFSLPYVQKAKLLFNNYYALPRGGAEKLTGWLMAEPGRALVLAGLSAGAEIDGTRWGAAWDWDRTALNAPRQFASLIGEISGDANGYAASKKPSAVLLAPGGKPLLTRYDLTGDRRVYFYGGIPGKDCNLDRQAVELILKAEVGEPEFRNVSGRSECFTFRFGDGTRLYSLFNHNAMDQFKMNPLVRTEGRFDWKTPGLSCEVTADCSSGNYTRFDFLTGKSESITVGNDGKIHFSLNGIASELIFLVPEKAESSLATLRIYHENWRKALR